MRKFMIALCLAALAGGCYSDRPHEAGQMRPDPGDLDRRDRGLQSRDVLEASEQIVQQVLALPEMNQSTRQTIVVTRVTNDTTNPYFNYDIFLRRLRGNIARYGRDRIFLVENRQRVAQVRSEEIETNQGDEFGQGGGNTGAPVPSTSVQPEWELYGQFTNLPNRGTDYYLGEFILTNIRTREQIPLYWEGRVAR
ncbi:MAG: hypothetical protein IT448_03540 [Phycisphaerales bacterium]|nr:hypothetical protein [Phycisphaerales bacterium]